jgi:glycosyltransferase involved in cell wall biosynthesis
MRITFLNAGGFNDSGGHRVISIYGSKLQARGHEVLHVSVPVPPPAISEQFRSMLRTGSTLRWPTPLSGHITKAQTPHKMIERYRPIVDADVPDADVVIATWWETAEWAAKLSPSKGLKVNFFQHYEVFDYTPRDRVEAVWRLPFKKIVLSKWLLDLARDKYGDSDAVLALNSTDTSLFDVPARDKQRQPTIGFLYHDAAWKGTAVALEAARRVQRELPNLRLKCFGQERPNAHNPLPEFADYSVRPPQDMIRNIYAQCDVWLCTSLSEGFHLPPLEAMACRCPVVSTAVGGAIDIVKEGINGYIVGIGDVDALTDRLLHVLKMSAATWQTMSDAAYDTARNWHTWDDAADIFEAALIRWTGRDKPLSVPSSSEGQAALTR